MHPTIYDRKKITKMNRDEFIVCREYAAMDLAFSMYNLHENLDENSENADFYGASEKGYYDWFTRVIGELLAAIDDGDARGQLEAAAVAEAELK